MDIRTSRFSNEVSPESSVIPELSCFKQGV